MSAATKGQCGDVLYTPDEQSAGRCLPCALWGPPSHSASPPSRATVLALLANQWLFKAAQRGREREAASYDPRDADRDSDDGPPRVDAGTYCSDCGAGIARDDTTCSCCRADVREAS